MTNEPTAGEVSRQVTELRQDNRDEHSLLRAGLRHKVDRAVYDADMRRWEDRYDQLREQMKQQANEHAAERKAFQDWRAARDRNRKWWIGVFILPIGSTVVEFIEILRSAHS